MSETTVPPTAEIQKNMILDVLVSGSAIGE